MQVRHESPWEEVAAVSEEPRVLAGTSTATAADNGFMPSPEHPNPSPPTSESGVDLAQIEARLKLTPDERFRLGVSASRRMIDLGRRVRRNGERDAT
jgi:hypothetical protein